MTITNLDTMPQCDGWCDHANPVTHLDTAGFVYCTPCGLIRREYEPCRKLRPFEMNRLLAGKQITKY